MIEFLMQPWPWYVAGPLIGLFVPVLLIVGGKAFGLSSNLRHLCAATMPAKPAFLRYDWKTSGLWNLSMAAGIVLGGVLAATWMMPENYTVDLSPKTVEALQALGITSFTGFVPSELISWSALTSMPGLLAVLGGGFLVGFGARYAGGALPVTLSVDWPIYNFRRWWLLSVFLPVGC